MKTRKQAQEELFSKVIAIHVAQATGEMPYRTPVLWFWFLVSTIAIAGVAAAMM